MLVTLEHVCSKLVDVCSDVRCVVISVASCIRERRGRPEWLEVSVGHPECDECPPDTPHHRACHDRAHWKQLLRCGALSDHLTRVQWGNPYIAYP